MKKLLLVTVFAVIPSAAFAQQGTAQDAKAMLEKTAAAINADLDLTLGQINKGENGFRVGDIYPFCNRISDGKALATPASVPPLGIDARELKDPTGKEFGKEMDAAWTKPEGVISVVDYQFPKPGTSAPAFPKQTFLMRVAADIGCGVGYYTTPQASPGPQEAKAMLEKAAAAIKVDREVALAQFNRGQFNRAGIAPEADLYPFCIRLTDGKLIASPAPAATVGVADIRLNPAFGKALYEAMSKPEATEITYLFPKPGTTAPALPKSTIAMRVAPDLGCGVGYYR